MGVPLVINCYLRDGPIRECGSVCGVPCHLIINVRSVKSVLVRVGALCAFAVRVAPWVEAAICGGTALTLLSYRVYRSHVV